MNRAASFALALTIVFYTPPVIAQDAVAVALDRIYREYLELRQRPNVARLVLLDQELRMLIPYGVWQQRPSADSRSSGPLHEAMGVSPLLFEGYTLGYSGKLLVEAHALDPKSYRSYTLYSTVFHGESEVGTAVPSPDAARAYLKEFPNGPFVVAATIALAFFYDDLFKLVKREEAGVSGDYKYDCYKQYLDGTPLARQRQRAQQNTVRYFKQLVTLLPNVEFIARSLAEIEKGRSEGWHYCAD
jgi:hypothetical protein